MVFSAIVCTTAFLSVAGAFSLSPHPQTGCARWIFESCAPKQICARDYSGRVEVFPNQCYLEIKKCYGYLGHLLTEVPCPKKDCSEHDRGSCMQMEVCARDHSGAVQRFGTPCQLSKRQCEQPEKGWTRVDCTSAPHHGTQHHGQTQPKPDCSRYDNMMCASADICARNKHGATRKFTNYCTFGRVKCEEPHNEWQESTGCDGPQSKSDCSRYDQMMCGQAVVCGRNSHGELKQFGSSCSFDKTKCMEPEKNWQSTSCQQQQQSKPDCSRYDTMRCASADICARNKHGATRKFTNYCTFGRIKCEEPHNEWQESTGCDGQQSKPDCSRYDQMMCGQAVVCARNSHGESKQFGSSCTFGKTQCMEPEKNWQQTQC